MNELFYTIRFLKQEFKRNKLVKEYPVIIIKLQADNISAAFNEAEFLASVNNPDITYNCIVGNIDFTCNQFNYEVVAPRSAYMP